MHPFPFGQMAVRYFAICFEQPIIHEQVPLPSVIPWPLYPSKDTRLLKCSVRINTLLLCDRREVVYDPPITGACPSACRAATALAFPRALVVLDRTQAAATCHIVDTLRLRSLVSDSFTKGCVSVKRT